MVEKRPASASSTGASPNRYRTAPHPPQSPTTRDASQAATDEIETSLEVQAEDASSAPITRDAPQAATDETETPLEVEAEDASSAPMTRDAPQAATDETETPLEVEADDASTGDGYESASDRVSSLATSLSSSIRDYNFENKRRYHKYKEGQYHFPNDDAEQERENMKHHMIVALCEDKLHNAPLKDPKKILDIGTGTGIWAIEMGDLYPDTDIEGIDLSPIQPPFLPPNVHFTVDDVESEWLYAEDSLDYIHLRHMYPSIKNWPRLLQQAYKALRPGGWLELQDIVPECKFDNESILPGGDYAPARMMDLIKEGVATFGVDLVAGKSHQERIEAAGFQNLVHDKKRVPIGTWPEDGHMKSIGSYARAMVYDGLHGNCMGPFTRGLGWTPEEVEIFLIQCRKDLMDDSFHPYIFYHSYTAQKPV